MRRLCRILLHVATGLSLALCIGVVILFARHGVLAWVRVDRATLSWTRCEAYASPNGLRLGLMRVEHAPGTQNASTIADPDDPGFHYTREIPKAMLDPVDPATIAQFHTFFRGDVYRRWRFGFAWYAADPPSPTSRSEMRLLLLPWWFALALTGLLPSMLALAAIRWAWGRQRVRVWTAQQRCAACGYDCRATPDRCPECGAVQQKQTA